MGMNREIERQIGAQNPEGEKALRAWQTLFNALIDSGVVLELPVEARSTFTDSEREALITDGAIIYTATGKSIEAQKEAQTSKNQPSFWDMSGGASAAGDRLLAVPSRRVDIAIYPEPERFFVPGSFNKTLEEQEELVAQDTRDLRKRLNKGSIGVIIPTEASTLTDIVFQHFNETRRWLLGYRYAETQGLNRVYVRTKNPIPMDYFEERVACVGISSPDNGMDIRSWPSNKGYDNLGAARLVVPTENQ